VSLPLSLVVMLPRPPSPVAAAPRLPCPTVVEPRPALVVAAGSQLQQVRKFRHCVLILSMVITYYSDLRKRKGRDRRLSESGIFDLHENQGVSSTKVASLVLFRFIVVSSRLIFLRAWTLNRLALVAGLLGTGYLRTVKY